MVAKKLLKQRSECLLSKKCTPFFTDILKKICHSLNHLSLENPNFFAFICLFDSINDPMSDIYWDGHYSRCFDDLVGLTSEELQFLQNFLEFSEQNLSHEELQLCQDNFLRAKADIAWLLDLDQFYQYLINNFTPSEPFASQDIIHPKFNNEALEEAPYIINFLANKHWETIPSSQWLRFLQGYDFYFLSETAYALVVPACIKLCIDDFRNQSKDYPFEYVSVLLNDKNRATSANTELKKLVTDFLQVFSHPTCFVGNDDELKKLWQV